MSIRTRITPVAYRGTGFVGVDEGHHDYYSVSVYKDAKGYGWGWFPIYDFQSGVPADAFGYMYKNRDTAEQAVNLYTETV